MNEHLAQDSAHTRYFAVVDPLDHGGVLYLCRSTPDVQEVYRAFVGWTHPDEAELAAVLESGPARPISPALAADVEQQLGVPIKATPEQVVVALAAAFLQAKGTPYSRSLTFPRGLYLQWLDVGPHVQVEVSANGYLPPDRQLDLERQLAVAQAGMIPPGLNSQNWSWAISEPEQAALAAAAVVGALGVWGITPGEVVGRLPSEQTM